MTASAHAGAFGPTELTSRITFVALLVSLLADRVVGGRPLLRTAESDRGSYWIIQGGQLVGLGLGSLLCTTAGAAALPGWVWVVGVSVMAAGAALRVWAVHSLGPAFRRDVVVNARQEVVDAGPYRWVRHPSYAGALLIFSGLGLAMANWLSLLLLATLPLAAYLRRIAVEEAALESVLGDRYRSYADGRARLVPAVW